ncbi:MAG: phosphoenolpyruvate carboxykinase (ATP) [Acidobacteriota bacterium]
MTTAMPSSRRLELEIPAEHRLANLSPARLYEEALARGEAVLAAEGPLLATTGPHTGRSPNDRFVVRGGETEALIDWGAVNKPIEPEAFDRLFGLAADFVRENPVYVFEGYAGADLENRIKVRVVTQRAWHNLFARNMFLREDDPAKLEGFEPDFTVIDIPTLEADPERDGTRTSTFVLLDLDRSTALIGGTEYAGEIKKSVFAVMNFLLPQAGVLSMHCSANYGATSDDVALFFGLSGTGKTTLSADPDRTLIGDDEHGWGDGGVFNVEGGCYAKTIRLDPEAEPAIFSTTRRFGTVLENVVCDPETRVLDLDDDSLTENTRSSYPITHLDNVDLGGVAGHPKTVVFLTCDAFGVLPPLSRLDEAQAMYHFLSGYTAKVAGTERGVTEPTATFSACFGAPFMPLPATRYAEMLGERVRQHDAKVFLVNTGWTGGPYGVGQRISLPATRRLVSAALSGELESAEFVVDPVFGLAVPRAVEGVDPALLDPRSTWQDATAYDAQAAKLAQMFRDNFEAFSASASDEIRAAAPKG